MGSQQSSACVSASHWLRHTAPSCSCDTFHFKSQTWDNLHFQREIRWWEKEEPAVLSSCIGLEKTTTVAAEDDSRVPAGDTMGSSQLFRQAGLKERQPSSLSHISEAEEAAFIPPFCDLASWHYSWWKMNQVRSWGCDENWLCCTLVSVCALLLGYFYWWVKYCILLNYHFMLLTIIGRRAWQIIITLIYNWLMCIVDSMHSFLKEGGEVWDFNLKDFVMFLYSFRVWKKKRGESRKKRTKWKDRDSCVRQAEIMS